MERDNMEETKTEEKNKTWLEILKGIGTIGLYLILEMIGAFFFGDFFFSSNLVIATLAQLGTYTIMLSGLAIVYRKRLKKDFQTFKKENIKIALKNWLIGLVAMCICNIIISIFIQDISANESANRELLNSYLISNIIIMIFIAPLIEEITFRASFKNAFKKWYTFALTTGFIFGFAHIIAGLSQNGFTIKELIYIFPYGTLGFFFAKAFYETDNIYTSMIAHILHNAMCVTLIILM